MPVTEGAFAVAGLVLIVGGVLKLRDPRPTREMLRLLGVPGADVTTHVSAGMEVALGLLAVLFGGSLLAWIAALAYGVFAVMIAILIRMGDAARTCGCFGSISVAPSPIHLVVDLGLAAIATLAAVSGTRGAVDYWAELVGGGLPYAVAVATACALVVAVMTVGPGRPARRASP